MVVTRSKRRPDAEAEEGQGAAQPAHEGRPGGEEQQEGEGAEGEAPTTTGPTAKRARHDGEEAGAAGTAGEEGQAAAEPGAGAGEARPEGAGKQEAGAGPGAGSMVEEGRIQFFYRPKVGLEEAEGLADVQRFFMLLRPSKEGVRSRLCVMGKKRLPSARKHERFFGFVEASSEDAEQLLQGLGPKTYETKTRGTHQLAAARALGQGTYGVIDHLGHTNLVYKLEVPAEPGKAQHEFNIEPEGSFIFSVKKPAGRGAGDPGLTEKADYEEKQEQFGGYTWIPVRDTQLLDYERCEFLLVGASQDVHAELGQKEEQLAGAAQRRAESACGAESEEECLLQHMKEEMQAERVGIETQPAEKGKMV